MLNNFSCPICSSSDPFPLQCGHIQCRLCSQSSNQENIPCFTCHALPVSNDDTGVNNFNQLCIDCGKNFASYAQYQGHKKKEACSLIKYGCTQQFNSCSMDKHLRDENHIHATKLLVHDNLESSVNLNLIQVLYEFSSQNNNDVRSEAEVNDDGSESIDHFLVLDFDHISTIHEIESLDRSQLVDEKTQQLLDKQFTSNEQCGNLIQSRMNQLDTQLNNEQEHQILEQRTTISTMQNQLPICQSCQKESDMSLSHTDCRKSEGELQAEFQKLSVNNKQEKETNQRLIRENQSLITSNGILETELSSVPHSKNGLIIWFIKNLSDKIDQSYPRSKRFIDSPRFLSLIGEHPLNVRLFLYGDSFDHPNFISIHIILSPGGNNNHSIPLTCCLVDQTNNSQHIIKQTFVHLSQQNIGTICSFSQFVQAIDIHRDDSSFVDNNGTLCLIVKLHENDSNQYNHYPMPIQNALQQINS